MARFMPRIATGALPAPDSKSLGRADIVARSKRRLGRIGLNWTLVRQRSEVLEEVETQVTRPAQCDNSSRASKSNLPKLARIPQISKRLPALFESAVAFTD
jgi:hypothetical protein